MISDSIAPEWIEFGPPHGPSFALASGGPVGAGWPAIVRLEAGGLRMKRECGFASSQAFSDAVSKLHVSLSGQAKLESLNGDVTLSLVAGELGRVGATAAIRDRDPFDCELKVSFNIDQSYLPFLRSRLRTEFLNRAQR